MLMDYVIAPRDKERTQPGQRHLYDKEAFGLRHKTFWGLDMTQSLLTKFIHNLTHESDGLIFQPVRRELLGELEFCSMLHVCSLADSDTIRLMSMFFWLLL